VRTDGESFVATDKPAGSGEPNENPPPTSTQRLGGARADFVASLGRKIADLRAVLAALEATPDSVAARDDLRRKLHALGAGARMLHFEAMTRSILDTESFVEHAAEEGALHPADVERVGRALDDLPALAWGEERPAEAPPQDAAPPSAPSDPAGAKALIPASISVLVVGPEALADALVPDGGGDDGKFECERVDDLKKARPVTLAFAPDVVVLDGDLKGSADFAQQLLDDPMTDAAPVIVVLTPGRGDGATRFMALGVARILARPLKADTLRAACQEAIDQRDGKTIEMSLGEQTIAQLGERLAAEVRRALVDSVDEHARSMKVTLGDGAEVWGALWGAIARVREVVTTSTGGIVQFSGHGPEGAFALAPIMSRVAPSDRAVQLGRNRDDAMDVNLAGRRVIVADDDPGVTWFISDLLRTAGCVVHEALDGRTALRMAYDTSPELVVSDILMPGLDGFALCRALRRDVALRDTPVILLSWKEDLLQRVRELGASAAAYLRKESDARAILARVREVLRPRARIAARLRGEGEVRGRLDGLTVRTLLELVVAARPAARVAVRDASFLYEVELRGGGIHRASRTSGDGTFLRGDRVIPAMLGVGAGRFVVTSMKSPPAEVAVAPLGEQFARPIALARSALHATTGERMMTVAKVVLHEEDVAGYLLATPEPARDLVRRLARGSSPRELLLQGGVSPALVEDVLGDLSTRGAIVAVYREDGTDAMRGEAFDPKSALREADAARSGGAPGSTGSVRPPGVPLGPVEPRVAPLDRALVQAMGGYDSDSPPRTEDATDVSASAARRDVSIPVTVEPTADLRARPGEIGSVPMSVRPRPSKPAPPVAPATFPRPLATGLAILALVIVAIVARFATTDPSEPRPPERSQPGAPDTANVTFGDLPPGSDAPPGQGLLSVGVADGVSVKIDGNESRVPRHARTLRLPLPPGVHLVAVGGGDKVKTRIVEVRVGRATFVDFDEP